MLPDRPSAGPSTSASVLQVIQTKSPARIDCGPGFFVPLSGVSCRNKHAVRRMTTVPPNLTIAAPETSNLVKTLFPGIYRSY